ncbi:hypothetical protein KY326_04895 [Candidatus Woesearchaeota archaeon]|nr:hypothetical protein [Candidatus Woesearchaeota archaeon]
MADLIQRLQTEPIMIRAAVKSVKHLIGKHHIAWLFNRAVEDHVREIISDDPDAYNYDDEHPFLDVPFGTLMASRARFEPKDYMSQKRRKPIQIKSFGLAYDPEERHLMLCQGTYGFLPTDEQREMKYQILSLLFDYHGKPVYGIARFIDPIVSKEHIDAVSPLTDIEKGKRYVQRALGKFVNYWGIINQDFFRSLPAEEIERFQRDGHQLVVLPITMEDAKIFEGCVREEVANMKRKARKTTKALTPETIAQYSQRRDLFF